MTTLTTTPIPISLSYPATHPDLLRADRDTYKRKTITMNDKTAIRTTASLLPAFSSYIGHMIGPVTAAKILARNLGRDRSAWTKFLRKDREPRNKKPRIAWHRHQGRLWYAEVDVYAYVLHRDPKALLREEFTGDPSDNPNLNMWSGHVHADIDFEDGPRAVVYVEISEGFRHRGMTPKAARELATSLMVTADQCDRDTPADIFRRLDSRSFAPKPGSGGPTTGDPELDNLLADLG